MDIQLALNKVYVQLVEHQSKMIKNTLLQDDGRLALANSPAFSWRWLGNAWWYEYKGCEWIQRGKESKCKQCKRVETMDDIGEQQILQMSVDDRNGVPWPQNTFGKLELCGPVSVLAVEWITPSIHLAEPCRAMRPMRLWCDLCDWDRGRFSESQSIHVDPTSKQHQCFLSSDQPEWFSEYSRKMKRDEVCLENFDETHINSKIDISTLFKASWSAPLSFRCPWFLFLQIVRPTPMNCSRNHVICVKRQPLIHVK